MDMLPLGPYRAVLVVKAGDVANWAAAIATFFAALIALAIPIVQRGQQLRDDKKRKAEAADILLQAKIERQRTAAILLIDDIGSAIKRCALISELKNFDETMWLTEADHLAANRVWIADLPPQAARRVALAILSIRQVNADFSAFQEQMARRRTHASDQRNLGIASVMMVPSIKRWKWAAAQAALTTHLAAEDLKAAAGGNADVGFESVEAAAALCRAYLDAHPAEALDKTSSA